MRDKLKKYSLPLLAAALVSVSLASCSKDKAPDPEPGLVEARKETTTTTAEITETVSETKKQKKTTAASDEKKPAETTNKKKTTTAASKAPETDKPEADSNEPQQPFVESLVDDSTGFFSDKVVGLLGKNRKQVLASLSFNEDYMVEKDPDKEDNQTLHYVVDNEKKYAFTFEFSDGKLTEVTCDSIIKNFNTALSAAKSMNWIKDESKTAKGKRVYTVPGKKTVYTILKTRDEDDGSAFITQSYALRE